MIILGQDPTIKNKELRKNINTVLNLDKDGALKRYVKNICEKMNINFEE